MCILHSPLGWSYLNENTYAPDTGAVNTPEDSLYPYPRLVSTVSKTNVCLVVLLSMGLHNLA